MPLYVYSCSHQTKEVLLSTPKPQKCPHGCTMTRNYSSERAGLPPFKAYNTDAFPGGIKHITTRDQEKKLEKSTGFVRVQ